MSGNPFVDKLWEDATADAAKVRSTPGMGKVHVIMFRHESMQTSWIMQDVELTPRAACKRFEHRAKKTKNGYLVHVTPEGVVCCFVGRGP